MWICIYVDIFICVCVCVKEGSERVCVAPLPSPPHHLSLLHLNPYSLQCKQRLCHLHTCSPPPPAAAAAKR